MTLTEAFRLVVLDAMTGDMDIFITNLYSFVQKTSAQQLAIVKDKVQDKLDELVVQRDDVQPVADAQITALQIEIDDLQDFIDTH